MESSNQNHRQVSVSASEFLCSFRKDVQDAEVKKASTQPFPALHIEVENGRFSEGFNTAITITASVE